MYQPTHLKRNQLPTTISRVKRYNTKANRNDPDIRDPRYLLATLKRLPQADQYLFGLFQTRKLAVLGFDWEITYPNEANPTEKDKKRLKEIKTRFREAKIRELAESIINGRLYGMSCVRLDWTNTRKYGTMVSNIKEYDLTDLDIDLDNAQKLKRIKSDDKGSDFTRKDFTPEEKHLMNRYNPFKGVDNSYIGGLARINLLYVLLKYWDFHNWSENNEKFADPTAVAKYKPGTSEDKIQKILDQLANLAANSRAALPDNVEMDLIEAMRKSSAEAHQTFNDQVNPTSTPFSDNIA